MKLLYLYVDYKDNAKLNLSLNFDSALRFSYNGGRLSFKRCGKEIPQEFFQGKKDPLSRVSCVSAIIGDNGAGKTSVAAALGKILQLGRPLPEYVVIYRDGAGLKCYDNLDVPGFDEVVSKSIGEKWHRISEKDKKREAIAPFDIIYLTPHFSPICIWDDILKPWQHEITPRRRLHHCIFDVGKNHTQNELDKIHSHAMDRLVFEEKSCAMDFAHWFSTQPEKTREGSPFPLPAWIRVGADIETVLSLSNRIESWNTNESGHQEVLNKLRSTMPALRSDDVVLRTLAVYAMSRARSIDLNAADFPSSVAGKLLSLCGTALNCLRERFSARMSVKERARYVQMSTEHCDAKYKDPTDYRAMHDAIVNALEADKAIADISSFFHLLVGCVDAEGVERAMHMVRIPITDSRLYEKVLKLRESQRKIRPSDENILYSECCCMSAGEISYLTLFGYLKETLEKISKQRRDVLLFFDEAETSMHPEWQRYLVHAMIWLVECLNGDKNVHIVFASHSPMLLSDIPAQNVLFIKKDKTGILQNYPNTQTFGGNIYDLFKSSFILPNGPVGEFAREKIRRMLVTVSGEVGEEGSDKMKMTREDVRQLVPMVGDPALKHYFEVLEETGIL